MTLGLVLGPPNNISLGSHFFPHQDYHMPNFPFGLTPVATKERNTKILLDSVASCPKLMFRMHTGHHWPKELR